MAAKKSSAKSTKKMKDLKPLKKSSQSVKGGTGIPDVARKIRQRLGPTTPPPQ